MSYGYDNGRLPRLQQNKSRNLKEPSRSPGYRELYCMSREPTNYTEATWVRKERESLPRLQIAQTTQSKRKFPNINDDRIIERPSKITLQSETRNESRFGTLGREQNSYLNKYLRKKPNEVKTSSISNSSMRANSKSTESRLSGLSDVCSVGEYSNNSSRSLVTWSMPESACSSLFGSHNSSPVSINLTSKIRSQKPPNKNTEVSNHSCLPTLYSTKGITTVTEWRNALQEKKNLAKRLEPINKMAPTQQNMHIKKNKKLSERERQFEMSNTTSDELKLKDNQFEMSESLIKKLKARDRQQEMSDVKGDDGNQQNRPFEMSESMTNKLKARNGQLEMIDTMADKQKTQNRQFEMNDALAENLKIQSKQYEIGDENTDLPKKCNKKFDKSDATTNKLLTSGCHLDAYERTILELLMIGDGRLGDIIVNELGYRCENEASYAIEKYGPMDDIQAL